MVEPNPRGANQEKEVAMTRTVVLEGCKPATVCALLQELGFVLQRHKSEVEEFIYSGHTKTKEWWDLQAGVVSVTVNWESNEVIGVLMDGYLTVTVWSEHSAQ